MYSVLNHPQKPFDVGYTCYIPTFTVSPLGDNLFIHAWRAKIVGFTDDLRRDEAIVRPETPDRCPHIVPVGFLGHNANEAKCRLIEWTERFVDTQRAYRNRQPITNQLKTGERNSHE